MASIGPLNKTAAKYSLRGLLREVFVVTEWKDGCIYRTRSVGFIASTFSDNPVSSKGQINAISTRYMMALMEVK